MKYETPYMDIKAAAACTGLSQFFLRSGCIDGTIPHIMSGKKYLINMPLFLENLEAQSLESISKVKAGDGYAFN